MLGWRVDDIRQAMTDLRSKGVGFAIYEGFGQDGEGVWTSDAAQVAWFYDPEGNNISGTQFA